MGTLTIRPELPLWSAAELAAAIRAGRLRSAEVTAALLDRIRRHDPQVHALAHLDADGAMRQAEAADRAVATGEPLGPLHGVPMTVKDGFRVGGTRSSFGLPHLKFHRPTADCEAVARVRRAGAVFLGRTAVPFACFDWQCKSPLAPECVNPLDPARTPGGSSGGAAAALAARFTPLEIGTDIAGSVRYPAHCCGVFGLRATVGAIPLADSGPPGPPLDSTLIAPGPMARTLPDLELLLSVLMPDPEPAAPVPDRLRVAVTPAVEPVPLDPSSAAVVRDFTHRLQAAGHEVAVLGRPPFDFADGYALWGLLAGYEIKRSLPVGLRNRLAVRAFAAWFLRYRLGDGPMTRFMTRGLLASDAEYRAGMAERGRLIATMGDLFRRYDLWALPVAPSAAIPRRPIGVPFRRDGETIPYSRYLGTYLCPTAVIGTPALVGPVGTDRDGLPVGVQLHAPRFADRWLVRAARERLEPLFRPACRTPSSTGGPARTRPRGSVCSS